MESNCNSRTSFAKCLECQTSDDLECAINPQKVESKVCKNYNDQCFTYIGKTEIFRGCLMERNLNFLSNTSLIDHCRSNTHKCERCDTFDEHGCNNRTIPVETCVECDSEKDPRCREYPQDFKNKVCNSFKIHSSDSVSHITGCYLSIVS